MGEEILYLREMELSSLVSVGDAVEAVEEACVCQGCGDTIEIPKALGRFRKASSLHSLGSVIPSWGIGGFKNWINVPGGAMALMTVFDIDQGRVVAILEAGTLGRLRTSAISAVATKWMTPSTVDELTLIGSGRQALMQIAALARVRPLRQIRVYSPTPSHRKEFCRLAAEKFPFVMREASTLESALDGAALVTVITRAQEPFITADLLAPGSHVNALGAILPSNAELCPDVFDRASIVAVDSVAAARESSRELIEHFETAASWNDVCTLADIVNGKKTRSDDCSLSIFKAMGMGISDLAIAKIAIQRAVRAGLGTTIRK